VTNPTSTSTGTTTKAKRSKGDIKPSTQDPIQRWLDIFMPMTGLPKARQADIRAELEDHLRARVDDLMITGLSEPEAVQKAVNELGETAHLARQFRTALKPKGRTLMHAALIAIAGSALTLGIFSAANQPGTPPARTAAIVGATATPSPLSGASSDARYAFAGTAPFEFSETATLGSLFDAIREATDRPLVIHWNHLEDIGIQEDTSIAMDADPVPLRDALALAIRKTETRDFGGIAVLESPGMIEISSTEEVDRRTVEVRTYDIADLLRHRTRPDAEEIGFDGYGAGGSFSDAAVSITGPLMEMVARETWADLGGDLSTLNLVGGSLLIKSPARYHAQIEAFLELVRREDARIMESADERLEETRRLQAERDERRRQAHLEQARLMEEQSRQMREEAERRKMDEIAHLEAELERVTAELAELNASQQVSMFSRPASFYSPNSERTEEEIREIEENAREAFIRGSRVSDLTVIRESIRDQLILLKYGVQPSEGTTLEAIQQQLKEQGDRLRSISNRVNN